MARPRTEKASYTKIQLRIPDALLQAYRQSANSIGRPLNTELVWALERAKKCSDAGEQNRENVGTQTH